MAECPKGGIRADVHFWPSQHIEFGYVTYEADANGQCVETFTGFRSGPNVRSRGHFRGYQIGAYCDSEYLGADSVSLCVVGVADSSAGVRAGFISHSRGNTTGGASYNVFTASSDGDLNGYHFSGFSNRARGSMIGSAFTLGVNDANHSAGGVKIAGLGNSIKYNADDLLVAVFKNSAGGRIWASIGLINDSQACNFFNPLIGGFCMFGKAGRR